ncbi:MAG TPA: hypothetical protein VKG78_00735, partial [Opitutaceae bacterium]|nr:hypothetical protein [Opitutaceae bacterium]
MNERKANLVPSPHKIGLQPVDVHKGAIHGPSHEGDIAETRSAILAKLTLAVGKDPATATDRDWFVAAALMVRDRVIHRWLTSERASRGKGCKRVCFLSIEFLIGRLFDDVLGNLGLDEI